MPPGGTTQGVDSSMPYYVFRRSRGKAGWGVGAGGEQFLAISAGFPCALSGKAFASYMSIGPAESHGARGRFYADFTSPCRTA